MGGNRCRLLYYMISVVHFLRSCLDKPARCLAPLQERLDSQTSMHASCLDGQLTTVDEPIF